MLFRSPATPSGAVSSAEVERVGEALRGATPYLGGGDPSQVEKNREMVRRAASYLAGVELVAHDPELRYSLAQAYRSLGDAQRAGVSRFPGDRDAALGSYNRSGGLLWGLKRGGQGGPKAVGELELLSTQMAILGAVLPFSVAAPSKSAAPVVRFDPIPSPVKIGRAHV